MTAILVTRKNMRNDGTKQKRKGLVQVDQSGSELKAGKKDDPLPMEKEFDLCWFSPTDEVHLPET